MSTKPPLGLIPLDQFNHQVNQERIKELISAMRRYSEAKMVIPVYWVNELDNRLREFAEYKQ